MCTAMQLGIHAGARGVPSLLDAALPREATLLALRWARRTLLHPPPPDVGAALRTACRLLSGAPSAPCRPSGCKHVSAPATAMASS